MHPTLFVVGPWGLWHLPLVFVFFLSIVTVWTWFERRERAGSMRLTPALAAELVLQAALPTAITWLLVNRLGPLAVRSYGVMMLLAFFAALAWMHLDRERYGFTGAQALQSGLLGFAGGILGGRLGYVLLNWSEYSSDLPAVMDLWRGGMSWHGGLAGGLLVLLLGAHVMGVSFARVFDLAAPGVAVGYAIARVGCFLNGCCYGHPTDVPWAVVFPQTGPNSAPPVPVHPTQLYDVAGTLLFTLPMLLWTTRWLRRPFSRFLGFLVLSSIVRIVVEFYRRGATGEIFAPIPQLTIAQAASIAIIIVCAAAVAAREWQGWTDARRAGD
ncbi:MAG: prolipoprotein diacylglyceryl transferase [Armatimonadota bacterium]